MILLFKTFLKKIFVNHNVFFICILILFSLIFNYHKTIFLPPYSIHQWRQADGLSITLNYYSEGMKFLEPKIHFQSSKEGKAIGEFPIIYYINALIWKITCPSYFISRIINVLIVFLGLFALFKSSFLFLKNFFWSAFIPLLIFASPLYSYYANSFLINIPALSLLFISWYYIILFALQKKNKYLTFSILLITLSGLLRATMLIGYIPILAIFFLEFFNILDPKVFNKKLKYLPIIIFPVVINALWILFTMKYNKENDSIYFLTTIRPFWVLDNYTHIWSKFTFSLLGEFYHTTILSFLFVCFILYCLKMKQNNKHIFIITVILAIEILSYILLWFSNLDVHDYYLIELYIIIAPLLVGLLSTLYKNYSVQLNSNPTKIIALLILSFSLCNASVKTRIKYDGKEHILTKLFIPEEDLSYWRWYHWYYKTHFKSFETIKPYLRSIGITRDDIVISLPDQSPNITLFFMDQKGFTSLYYSEMSLADRFEYFMSRGAKYLIINDLNFDRKDELSNIPISKIGQYKNIEIYKLQNR